MESKGEGQEGESVIERGSSTGIFSYHHRVNFSVEPEYSYPPKKTHSGLYAPQEQYDSYEIFTLAFNHNNSLFAAAGSNSAVNVYAPTASQPFKYLCSLTTDGQSLPITAMKFRPYSSCYAGSETGGVISSSLRALGYADATRAPHVLAVACADGSVTHWHVPSQTCVFKIEEEDNQVIILLIMYLSAYTTTIYLSLQVKSLITLLFHPLTFVLLLFFFFLVDICLGLCL